MTHTLLRTLRLALIASLIGFSAACTTLSGESAPVASTGAAHEAIPLVSFQAAPTRTPTAVPVVADVPAFGAFRGQVASTSGAGQPSTAAGRAARSSGQPGAAPQPGSAGANPADGAQDAADGGRGADHDDDGNDDDGDDDGDNDRSDDDATGGSPPALADNPAPAPAPVNSCPSLPADLLAQLRAGGMVIYLRHAMTDWSQSAREEEWVDKWPEIPPDASQFEDCSQQRLLSDDGRAHAGAIGRAVGATGIPIARILTSRWCRVIDTASLAFGGSQTDDRLFDSGYLEQDSSDRKDFRSQLRSLLSDRPPAGQNVVLVGHMPQLLDAAGIALEEGTSAVFRPDGGGYQTVVSGMTLGDWECLAGP
jgi:phosphohistidine phosphatase SixA